MNEESVLIVGAGPTGLVAALVLRLYGIPVEIIDKAKHAPTSSRALGCQARSMEMLEALGVVDAVLAVSERVESSVLYNRHGPLGRQEWVPPEAPYPYTYVFPQTGLEAILRERLAGLGTHVQWDVEVIGVAQAADRMTAMTHDGGTRSAHWLIGADGGHSVVREACDIAFSGKSTGEAYYLADLDLAEPPSRDNALSWMTEKGPLMLMRMPDNSRRWRLFADVTEAEATGALPEPSRNLAQTLIDDRAAGIGRIEVKESVWESVYKVQIRQAESYRSGRVFLAGDAAHVFPPFGGQGMNTGILDACNLAWKLAFTIKHGAGADLLDTYQAERHPIGRRVIKEVEQRNAMYAVRGRLRQFLRDTLFRIILAVKPIQARISRTISQLDQSYAGTSWLSSDMGRHGGVSAGERAPDAMVAGERLFERFSLLRFTLLVFAGSDGEDMSLPGWVETVMVPSGDRAGFEAYGAGEGDLVLVRPDGYVGFRGRSGDREALRQYLARMASVTASMIGRTADAAMRQ